MGISPTQKKIQNYSPHTKGPRVTAECDITSYWGQYMILDNTISGAIQYCFFITRYFSPLFGEVIALKNTQRLSKSNAKVLEKPEY